ncbi:MAG: hypothetical protein QOE92_1433 [Chloroflexota bacterium]|jgi:alpha-1,3-rhamnosyl/mannosyltransferase|nr:hypothetical protein [Chloroflexota bacterium]
MSSATAPGGAAGTALAPVTEVLLDGVALCDASRFRGIGTYLASLLPAMARLDGLALSVLAPCAADLPAGVAHVSNRRLLLNRRFARREHRLRLGGEIRRHARGAFHSPGQDPPPACDRPWLQTIHSMIPLVYDHPALAEDRRHWEAIAASVRAASLVLAVSQDTADAAVRLLGLDPGRVRVTPLGVDPRFTPAPARSRPDPPYLLYVGEYGPWKGYAEAFEVVGRLAERGLPHRLRVAGRLAPWVEADVRRLVDMSPRPDRIDLLGYVSRDDLVDQYRGADALLFTSRCEGFGLPPLESMACGTPVLAFANSAVTEVSGEGAILVADGDTSAMTDAAAVLVGDRERHRAATARGIGHAAGFTWDRCARLHAAAYREVAG